MNGRTLLLLLVKMSEQIIKVEEEGVEPMDIREEQEPLKINQKVKVKEEESVELKQKIPSNKTEDSLIKFSCNVCNKRFTNKTALKRHTSEVHERVKKSKCLICDKQFTRKVYLNYHLKYTKLHNRLIRDEFRFDSFITGHYHYQHIWTPHIGEDLTTAHEPDNAYDEFAVSILKNNDTIVGHTPRQISEHVTALLKSEGTVNVKVVANPIKTRRRGIRVPCTYIVSGKRTFVQDIKDNLHKIE